MTLDTVIALARGIHLAAVLSVVGAAIVRAAVVPPALRGLEETMRRRVLRRQRIILLVSVVAALLMACVWVVVQAAAMADAATLRSAFAAVPVVLTQTVFGNAMLARLALLVLTVVSRRIPWLAAAFAVSAAAAQAWMGHAAGVREIALPLSEILHMTAAGTWLGGLLPLLLLTGDLPPDRAATAARRFSSLGIAAVLVMAATAFVQGRELVGGLPGLVGTPYGTLAAEKLGLFAVLIVLAALNRFRLTPRIAGGSRRTLRLLRASIAIEAIIGVAIVLTASRLAGLYPGAHEQAEWPFAWRIEWSNAFDPALRGEILPALAWLAAATALATASLLWRRIRLLGVTVAVIGGAMVTPHLAPLVVPAYPTSYYESLTEFATGSISRGATLFARNCAGCHGPDGRGDGPAGRGLRIPPADLTSDHIWAHVDGELFWWLTHGIEDPPGDLAMPGFASLSATDRWSLIDYVRAHAAGAEITALHHWPFPVLAPGLAAGCSDGRVLSNDDLRGTMWRIVVGATAPPLQMPTILLAPVRVPGACVADDVDARRAFAIVGGLTGEEGDGTQILIDAAGWLRARALPGEALDLSVAATPLPPPVGGHHH